MEIRKNKSLFLAIILVVALSITDVVAQENICNTMEVRSLMQEEINHLMQRYGGEALDLYDFKTIKFDNTTREITCEGKVQWHDISVEQIRFTRYKNSMGKYLIKVEAI